MREVLASLNIVHITTTPYHPRVMLKWRGSTRPWEMARSDTKIWDLYLTQALAALRFTINETSRFSPYYMLFGRDVVLSVDDLVKLHKKYMGEDQHQLFIEKQPKLFVQARRRIKKAQKRRNAKLNIGKEVVELGIGTSCTTKFTRERES